MHIVIIGNGVAAQTTAEQIRRIDSESKITMITDEAYPFYTRIYLPHYIAELRSLEKLILRKKEWFQQKDIHLILNTQVTQIDKNKKTVCIKKNQESISNKPKHTNLTENIQSEISYDKLVIATGSLPRIINFGASSSMKGVFALRKITDAKSIKKFIKDNQVKSAFIIGGGLLGIELAYHLKEILEKVSICEIAKYLLPRQLDHETSKILRRYLEQQGLNIYCGNKVQKIVGTEKVSGIILEDGTKIKTDIIFEQLGIIPNISLAKNAELETDKGIIVNEFLQTSDPSIYAVGDCVEFDGLIWGIIPACMDQAKIAAKHILNQPVDPYSGTFWNTKLKIAGLNVSCMGISPNQIGSVDQEMKSIDPDNYLCKKVFISKNKLKGAIILGDSNDTFFRKKLNQDVNITEIEDELNKD